MNMRVQKRLQPRDESKTHPMDVPGTLRRVRPEGKTQWTFTPWIRLRPGTDLSELINRAREDQFKSQ